jgi:hypothetical protein
MCSAPVTLGGGIAIEKFCSGEPSAGGWNQPPAIQRSKTRRSTSPGSQRVVGLLLDLLALLQRRRALTGGTGLRRRLHGGRARLSTCAAGRLLLGTRLLQLEGADVGAVADRGGGDVGEAREVDESPETALVHGLPEAVARVDRRASRQQSMGQGRAAVVGEGRDARRVGLLLVADRVEFAAV